MTSSRPWFLGLVLASALSLTASADAQLPFRWFGPKTNDKSAPAKASAPDVRRVAEINVELAWLADPITFPYYLQARVNGATLEVRGYVPDKTVREHALRMAQVYSSMPVADAMKEHPSLMVRPGAMSSQQLQTSVLTSLKVSLPKQHQQLKVECGKDGKVYVSGPVSTYEEKIAVSHSLRRLHGCTSVQNLTSLPGEIAQTPRDKLPTVVQNPPRPLPEPVQPELKVAGPVLIPNVGPLKNPPEVIKVESPGRPEKLPLTPAALGLQKRIRAVCPEAKSVELDFVTMTEVRISIELRAEKDITPVAERVLAMPELQNYRPDLLFRVATP